MSKHKITIANPNVDVGWRNPDFPDKVISAIEQNGMVIVMPLSPEQALAYAEQLRLHAEKILEGSPVQIIERDQRDPEAVEVIRDRGERLDS